MLKQVLPFVAPLLILAIVAWRMSRAARGRPVKPSRLWIRPAIIGVLMIFPLATTLRFDPLGVAVMVAAVAVGGGFGYLLARHQHLAIDPQTGAVTSRMSPVGMVLFVGLFAARLGFRFAVLGTEPPARIVAHSTQIALYTDAGLLFVFSLVAVQAAETWRRIRPLQADAGAREVAE